MSEKGLLNKIEYNVVGKVYRAVYRKTPKSYRNFCSDSFKYADITIPEEFYFGFLLIYGLVLSLCLFFIIDVSHIFTRLMTLLISIGSVIVFEIIAHYLIVMIGEKRAKVTEEILPDALKLMASNIRSGFL